MSGIDYNIFTRRGRPGNSTLCLDELRILTLEQNVFSSFGYSRTISTLFAWNYGKRGRSEVNMQIRDDLTQCTETIVTFPLRLNSSVEINRDVVFKLLAFHLPTSSRRLMLFSGVGGWHLGP